MVVLPFWFCVDLSIVNSFILEIEATSHLKRMQLTYQVKFAKELISDFSKRGRTASPGQLEAGH